MAELDREKAILTRRLEEWRGSHQGEFVLIHQDEVVGFFPSLEQAFGEGTRRFRLDPFLVEQITAADPVNVSFFGTRLHLSR